ncbi:helix-turn-helix transcriptional regulator [Mucilaginibacter sp.]|uniref:helix-turn-helix domain-containing protein n=1 Tax=Mucilaginibacter sp. TaxID=1882438 RepID=UPI0025D4856F|nr:helix-turn-helix transcriptional regulator [Mucilaginibacter sp.]
MNSLRSRINELISHLKLSKNEFAREIGLSSAMVSKITTKDINFGIDVYQKIISKYTNLNQQWLLTGVGEMWLSSERNASVRDSDSKATEPSNMIDVINLGVKLSEDISNRPVLYGGYFEENKLAFYLKHSDKRLDGLLSNAIDDLKNVYEAYRKLILFSESMGAPDFVLEKFPAIDEFKVYKRKFVDAEFKETYGVITDSKVLKCAKLIDYESNLEHYTFLLNKLIEYMYRYADMYQGYLTSDPLNRTNQHQ